ncbi:hypothetical protein [Streptomyces boninensis]|uniref:hypothetical protein n=1 Tax=Streptomyces boninensis TaxID=2039455 RepID=UPI003B20F2B1
MSNTRFFAVAMTSSASPADITTDVVSSQPYETSGGAMHPAAVEQHFTERSRRSQNRGLALLAVAALLWVYVAFQLFTPYGQSCEPVVSQERLDVYVDTGRDDDKWADAHTKATHCAAERDWPKSMTALALSLPFAMVGAVLYSTGAVSTRIRQHEADLARARSKDD